MTYSNEPQSPQSVSGADGAAEPPRAAQPAAERAPRSRSGSAILIVTSVVGGLALLGVASSTALGARASVPAFDLGEQSVTSTDVSYEPAESSVYEDATDITSIEIKASASSFTLAYADVTEVELRVTGIGALLGNGTDSWRLERDDEELVVERRGTLNTQDQDVTLVLPRELGEDRTASLEVQLGAGEFTGSGSFRELDLEVNAGQLEFTGDAASFEGQVNVGEANVELADVTEASMSVGTGEGNLTLTGKAPELVELNAQLGELTVKLPQAKYRVDNRGMLGELDNRLETSKDSKHLVTVEGKLAEVVLK